jgi:hypothetical protein
VLPGAEGEQPLIFNRINIAFAAIVGASVLPAPGRFSTTVV